MLIGDINRVLITLKFWYAQISKLTSIDECTTFLIKGVIPCVMCFCIMNRLGQLHVPINFLLLYKILTGCNPIVGDHCACILTHAISFFSLQSRPFGVSLLIAGHDENGPSL